MVDGAVFFLWEAPTLIELFGMLIAVAAHYQIHKLSGDCKVGIFLFIYYLECF